MDIFASGPVAGILYVIYQLVNALSQALTPIAGTAAAALAVVVLTMLVRALLIPVGVSQMRAQLTRRRLSPKLADLQRAHGHDKQQLQKKTMELYASQNASPLAGCLPLLLQAPVLSLVYALFLHPSINGHANALLSHDLFGVPLGTSFVHLLGAGQLVLPALVVFGVLLGLIAAVTAASRRLLAAQAVGQATASTNALTRVVSYLPFITVVFAVFVPLAATLYLSTTTAWALAERLTLRRILGHS